MTDQSPRDLAREFDNICARLKNARISWAMRTHSTLAKSIDFEMDGTERWVYYDDSGHLTLEVLVDALNDGLDQAIQHRKERAEQLMYEYEQLTKGINCE